MLIGREELWDFVVFSLLLRASSNYRFNNPSNTQCQKTRRKITDKTTVLREAKIEKNKDDANGRMVRADFQTFVFSRPFVCVHRQINAFKKRVNIQRLITQENNRREGKQKRQWKAIYSMINNDSFSILYPKRKFLGVEDRPTEHADPEKKHKRRFQPEREKKTEKKGRIGKKRGCVLRTNL